MKRKIVFEYRAFEDFNEWLRKDKKAHEKIRIDDEHRLGYKVTDDSVIIIACKSHY